LTGKLASYAAVATTILFGAGASAQTCEVTNLVSGSAFHGVHGLGIDKAGRPFAGSAVLSVVSHSTRARRYQP